MSTAAGFICAGISVIFWGSNFLPVKKYDTGDGMFFQWIMCTGIWMAGLIVQLIRQTEFQPIAMIGGVLWTTGNVLCVPVIQMIGMGLGLLLWGGSSLLMGWCSGKFGLFGLKEQKASNESMNVAGFCIALASLGILFFVKTSSQSPSTSSNDSKEEPLLGESDLSPGVPHLTLTDEESYARLGAVNSNENIGHHSYIDKMTPLTRRVVGGATAVLAGLFFGVNFDPPQYLIDHKKGSDNGIDYVFSHFCGIFLTSTIYFLIYCIYKRNKPDVRAEIILPSFISGIGWAIAQISFFFANTALALVITMPIATTGPGIVGMLWGAVLFKEIQGRRNFIILGCAIACVSTGVALIAASR